MNGVLFCHLPPKKKHSFWNSVCKLMWAILSTCSPWRPIRWRKIWNASPMHCCGVPQNCWDCWKTQPTNTNGSMEVGEAVSKCVLILFDILTVDGTNPSNRRVTSEHMSMFDLNHFVGKPFLSLTAFTIDNLSEDFFVPSTCLAPTTPVDFWREVKVGVSRSTSHHIMSHYVPLNVNDFFIF